MSFLVWLSIFFTSFVSNIEWNQTEVIVPLHGDFLAEIQKIEANLYIDGVLIEGARAIYKIDGVERTFLSTINTSILKTYIHKIEVYFPDYNVRNIMTIHVKIVDLIPPEIINTPQISIPIDSKLPNLMTGLQVIDNYDSNDLLKIEVDISKVDLSRIGRYPITYHIKDTSGNETKKTVWLEIYDHIPPDIKVIKPLKHNIDHIFSWSNYFTIKDNYDLFPVVTIQSDFMDKKAIGTFDFQISAKDQSGNITIIHTSIEVFDQTPPELIISSERPDIAYQSTNELSKLKRLILKVTDNVDELTVNDVEIISSINPNQIGNYLVTFQVVDSSMNKKSIDIYLKVTDQESPVIEIIKPLIFHVFDPNPIWSDYLLIYDNLTTYENLKVEYVGSYRMDQIGKYVITIKATDEAKNVKTMMFYVEVIDLSTPNIELIQDILITQFKPVSYIPYFKVTDMYDTTSQIKLSFDDQFVNYLKVGIYPLTVYATDVSHNQSELIVDVIVMDIEPPLLILTTQNLIEYPYGGKRIDLRTYIKEVNDNYDLLSVHDVIITGEVDTYSFGRYEIIYELTDQTGNQTIEKLYFLIVDQESPKIYFDDITINQYENIDLFSHIHVEDNSDEYELFIFPKTIDTSMPGSIVVTYIASDARGNYTIKERTIFINAIDQKPNIKVYVPAITIVLGGLTLAIFLYFKDVKHMF